MTKKEKKENRIEDNIIKDKILVVDIECTCYRGRFPKGEKQEIIEIGVSILDLKTKEIEKERGIIVIPTTSKINWFCTKLTSIDNSLIKKEGISFKKACEILKKEYNSENMIWGSWGKFDRTQFLADCKNKDIEYPFSDKYIDLQKMFSNSLKEARQYGVKTALEHFDLQFEGNEHRGVDDSYNTSRIIGKLKREFILNYIKNNSND